MTESTNRREETLLKKYGSAAALAAKRREWQAKSRLTYKGNGGFRSLSAERLHEISVKGGVARQAKRKADETSN